MVDTIEPMFCFIAALFCFKDLPFGEGLGGVRRNAPMVDDISALFDTIAAMFCFIAALVQIDAPMVEDNEFLVDTIAPMFGVIAALVGVIAPMF